MIGGGGYGCRELRGGLRRARFVVCETMNEEEKDEQKSGVVREIRFVLGEKWIPFKEISEKSHSLEEEEKT